MTASDNFNELSFLPLTISIIQSQVVRADLFKNDPFKVNHPNYNPGQFTRVKFEFKILLNDESFVLVSLILNPVPFVILRENTLTHNYFKAS
jgi:hypothetical protein